MLQDRNFNIAIIVSLVIHSLIIFYNQKLRNDKKDELLQQITVNYIRQSAGAHSPAKSPLVKKDGLVKLPDAALIKEIEQLPELPQDNKIHVIDKADQNIQVRELNLSKPAVDKPDIPFSRRKISLPPVDMSKIKNPVYISYYQWIREKIRQSAYQNYTGNETGEINLTFVISRNGELKDMKMMEDRSSNSLYLRSITLKSIKDSIPFPRFPSELDYPELSFNVIISFEAD